MYIPVKLKALLKTTNSYSVCKKMTEVAIFELKGHDIIPHGDKMVEKAKISDYSLPQKHARSVSLSSLA